MTDNEGPARLNESQRRHYEVLFARLERTLVQLEAAARDEDAGTVLTVVQSDVPARFAHEAPAAIEEARQQLATLAKTLSLRPRTESRRRICRALITSEVERADRCDVHAAARIRRGGCHAIATHLDPAIEELRKTVARIADLFA